MRRWKLLPPPRRTPPRLQVRIRQATLLLCTGVRNQTHNDRTLINLLRYPGSAFILYKPPAGQLGRSRVLSRLSPSRAEGGPNMICVPAEEGKSNHRTWPLSKITEVYWTCHNPSITGLCRSAVALITWAGSRRFQVGGPQDGINFNRNHNLIHRCMSPDQPWPNLLRTSRL